MVDLQLQPADRAITTMIKQNYQDVIAAQNMLRSLESDNSAQLLMMSGYPDAGYIQFQDNHRSFVNMVSIKRLLRIQLKMVLKFFKISTTITQSIRTPPTRLKAIITSNGHRAALDYNYTKIFANLRQNESWNAFKLLDMNHNEMVQTDTKANAISNQATVAVLGAVIARNCAELCCKLAIWTIHYPAYGEAYGYGPKIRKGLFGREREY